MYLKSVENVITLGKLIGLLFLFCLPLLSILFLKTKRNDLARPVMGTIFLVYICMSVGMYVCRGPKSVGGNTWAKRAHAQSQYCAVKSDQYHPYYWASEASPTLGCSIEISRDIYIYIFMSVCMSVVVQKA